MRKTGLKPTILRLLLTGVVAFSVLLTCCTKDDSSATYDPSKPIVLESFSPENGGAGSKLIIRGQNFGTDASKIKIRIANEENREARVISANGTRIYAILPARAGSGNITVTIETTEEGGGMQEAAFEQSFEYEFKKHLSTLCGGGFNVEDKDGSFKDAKFSRPIRLALDDENQQLYVLEANEYKCIRVLDLVNETVTTPWRAPGLHNLRTIQYQRDTIYVGVEGAAANVSTVYLLRSDGFIRHKTYAPQSSSNASSINPVDGELFINNYYNGSVYHWNRGTQKMDLVQKIFKDNSDWTYCWSLDGKSLFALCLDSRGGSHSCVVRMEYDMATKTLGEAIPWVGIDGVASYQEGVGTEALINAPYQMAAGPDNTYFLVDTYNHCIRKVTDNGTTSLYAGVPGSMGFTEGDPFEAQMTYPTGVAVSADGGTVYVADKENNRICKITVE